MPSINAVQVQLPFPKTIAFVVFLLGGTISRTLSGSTGNSTFAVGGLILCVALFALAHFALAIVNRIRFSNAVKSDPIERGTRNRVLYIAHAELGDHKYNKLVDWTYETWLAGRLSYWQQELFLLLREKSDFKIEDPVVYAKVFHNATKVCGEPSDAPKDRVSRFDNGSHNTGPR